MKTLKNVSKVRLLPYHNFAGSKYESLGKANALPNRLPTTEEMQKAIGVLRELGLKVVE